MEFEAEINQLRAMLQWIIEQLAPVEFPSNLLHKIELSSEEALVNIIHHSYQAQSGKIEIEVKVFPKSHVEIAIIDEGPPFNPLQHKKEIDRTASVDEREVGGLGIHFMRQYMDEIRYKRDQNSNVLVLIKRI